MPIIRKRTNRLPYWTHCKWTNHSYSQPCGSMPEQNLTEKSKSLKNVCIMTRYFECLYSTQRYTKCNNMFRVTYINIICNTMVTKSKGIILSMFKTVIIIADVGGERSWEGPSKRLQNRWWGSASLPSWKMGALLSTYALHSLPIILLFVIVLSRVQTICLIIYKNIFKNMLIWRVLVSMDLE